MPSLLDAALRRSLIIERRLAVRSRLRRRGKFSSVSTAGTPLKLFELMSRSSSVSPRFAKLAGSDARPNAATRNALRCSKVHISSPKSIDLIIVFTLP